MKLNALIPTLILTAALAAAPASAAFLTGSFEGSVTSATPIVIDAPTIGSTDWAIWAPAGSPDPWPNGAPTNSKADGTAISDLTAIGGTSQDFKDTGNTPYSFTYNGGSSPANDAGIFVTPVNSTGKGMSFTITGDPLNSTEVRIYVGAYAAGSRITASLSGASEYTSTEFGDFDLEGDGKVGGSFLLEFTPDNVSDVLTVQYTVNSVDNTSAFSHTYIEAVGVYTVPEPSSMMLVGLAGLMGLLVCRRKRV